jgi:hypothetical protein
MGEEAAPGRYELQQVPKDMDAEEQAFLRIRSGGILIYHCINDPCVLSICEER